MNFFNLNAEVKVKLTHQGYLELKNRVLELAQASRTLKLARSLIRKYEREIEELEVVEADQTWPCVIWTTQVYELFWLVGERNLSDLIADLNLEVVHAVR